MRNLVYKRPCQERKLRIKGFEKKGDLSPLQIGGPFRSAITAGPLLPFFKIIKVIVCGFATKKFSAAWGILYKFKNPLCK